MAAIEPVPGVPAQARVQVQVDAQPRQRDSLALPVAAALAQLRLAVGSQLPGAVVGGADGRLQVAVERGLLTLDGALPLPPGTRVIVQITALYPTIQGTLRLAATPSTPAAAEAPSVVVTTVAAGDAEAPAMATLLTPMLWDETAESNGPGAGPATNLLEAGTRLPVRVLAAGPPAPEGPGLPADPSGAPVERPAEGVRLTGVVSQILADGRAMTRAGGATLLLPPVTGLTPGETVALVIAGPPVESLGQPVNAVAALSAKAVLRGERWPALDAALTLPPATSAAIRNALPQANGTLAHHLQALVAAVRSGDPRVWLGAAPCTDLARRRPDLLAALTRDLDEVASAAEGAAGEDWVALGVPLLVGAQVQPVRLLFRDGSSGRSAQRPGGDRRFLVDLTLSRLGRVQIDMLIHGKLAMLDVVVRSDRPFPAADRDHIRALVREAVGCVDLVGSIDFQSAPARFAEVTAPAGARPDGVIV